MDKRLILKDILPSKHPEKLGMLIGFDGFIDEIMHPVDKRTDAQTFKRIETIEKFASRISKASGLSTNIELYPVNKKIGGNGPIMANALAQSGASITYIGAMGYPTIDDVFKAMPDNVKIHSVADAGHTDALEFHDGKLLMGKMASLSEVTYERIIETLGEETFTRLLSKTDLFATVNWSMLPFMTDLWKKMIRHILKDLPEQKTKPVMFIDLADPEKRENEEIIEALNLLKGFESRFRVILGLNKKEAYDTANVLGLFDPELLESMELPLKDLAFGLHTHLGIHGVVIHPVERSCAVLDGVYAEELGPYVKEPKLTTGAGDNFNAGFALGVLLGLDVDQALLLGMSTSGFYVRNARSPLFSELPGFIEAWASGLI